MYLLGMFKLAHDSDLKYVSVGRLFTAVITGMFTVYMIPGLWGAPLKIINAFPPPMHYRIAIWCRLYSSGGSTISHSEEEGQHLGPQELWSFTTTIKE